MRKGWLVWLGLVACSGDGTTSTDDPTTDTDTTDTKATETGTETGTDTGTSMPAPPSFENGSRLEAAYWDGGADAEMLSHWTDSQLGISCTPTRDPDGSLRCYPSASVHLAYLDKACTQPVFYWEPCFGEHPPSHVTGASGLGCVDARAGVPYQTGKLVAVDHAYSVNGCTRMDFPKARAYYQAIELPATDFVSYTEDNIAVADGLGVHHLRGSDGSGFVSSLATMTSDEACTAVNLGKDYASYCMPGEKAYEFDRAHTDAACKNGDVARIYTDPSCPAPDYVLATEVHPTCEGTYAELREAGDAIDREDVYWGTPRGCFPSPEDRYFYEVGDVAGNVLAPLDTAPVGTERLRLDHWVTKSGAPLMPAAHRWFDSTLGVTCGRQDTEAAGSRCLPHVSTESESGTYIAYFSDDKCTVPLVYRYIASCGAPEAPALVATFEPGLCGAPGPLRNVRAVGSLHKGAVFVTFGSTCDPMKPTAADEFYTVGDLVSLEGYAPLPLVD